MAFGLVAYGDCIGHSFVKEQRRLAVQADLDDVWPKQQRKGPVDHDAQSPAPTRHLEQIIRAPHEPGQDAMYPYLEELPKRLAMSQGTHHPQGVVDEWPGRLAIENGKDVA